ncbi:MAG TPA: site-specific DNA-methyltransferase [Rubrivivax sp.]|nr:site-specific DNA-methyltransferase [Rubrivivax sp.]HRZ62896.1 site-specific DNA-methyltransferase [Rubrivivax sp.]
MTRDWGLFALHQGDCREVLASMPAQSAHCCVTSPPYFGLRDYGHDGQIGLEPTPAEYVAQMVEVFREVRRVLRDDGTLWLNLGDSYAASRSYQVPSTKGGPKHSESRAAGGKSSEVPPGLKSKDLLGIPWRVAFALQADGWWLRQDIIWSKPNPMPESVRDRCTKAHEYVFLLSKSERYYFDSDAMQEPAVGKTQHDLTGPGYRAPGQAPNTGNRKALRSDIESRHRSQIAGGQSLQNDPNGLRNKRSVWTVATQPFKGAHFATFPPALIEPCVLAGSPPGGVVLDPFGGAGTTALVATKHGRRAVLCELNPEYVDLAERRIAQAIFGAAAFGEAA